MKTEDVIQKRIWELELRAVSLYNTGFPLHQRLAHDAEVEALTLRWVIGEYDKIGECDNEEVI